MAVEIGRVSLWLKSFVPGMALSYLGHNLQTGDALVGVASIALVAKLLPLVIAPGSPIFRGSSARRPGRASWRTRGPHPR